jgi:hypothetical protein
MRTKFETVLQAAQRTLLCLQNLNPTSSQIKKIVGPNAHMTEKFKASLQSQVFPMDKPMGHWYR